MPLYDQAYPRRADMWHRDSLVTVGNALAKDVFATTSFGNQNYQNAGANGDTFTNGFMLAAGTYTFEVLGVKGTNRGIVDWYVDNVAIATGQDWYNATDVPNITLAVSSVAVTYNGWHALKGVVSGKNASATGYFLTLTKMTFKPTAD